MFIRSEDGVRIHYIVKRKRGRPFVLFIHGLCGDLTEFKHQMDFLGKKYSIIAADLRGHGKSGKPKDASMYSLERFVSDIVSVLNKEKVRNPYIVGFSLGAYVAVGLSGRARCRKLVLINPLLSWSNVTIFFKASEFLSRFVPSFALRPFVKSCKLYEYRGLLDLYAKMLLKTPLWVRKNIVSQGRSMKLLPCRAECVVIKSGQDEILNSSVPYAKAKIIRTEGHHYVHCEHWREINRLVGGLLRFR